MVTKTIIAWIDGSAQEIEVEEMTSETQVTIEDRLTELEDKPIIADGNFLVGDGTKDAIQMTPNEVLEHIDASSFVNVTTEEYNAIETKSENIVYNITDYEEEPIVTMKTWTSADIT